MHRLKGQLYENTKPMNITLIGTSAMEKVCIGQTKAKKVSTSGPSDKFLGEWLQVASSA